MNTQLKNKVPEVRFPEFEEEWEFIHGNELFERISNKNHNSDLPILAISQEFGAIPRHLINYKISVTEKSVSSYKVVEKGDFIISLRSFQGGIEYSNYKGICSPAYIILRPTIELEADFYKSHFKSFRYIQQLHSKLEGIRDGKMISYKYFSEIKLPFPTLPEQQKIAHFFSIIDKKITQLQEKKTALELYKKGMMQRLFCLHDDSDDLDDEQDFEKDSQEKNQGNQENQKKSRFRLRFKDDNGNDFPEWEVKKLGEVFSIFNGYAFSSKSSVGNGIVWVKIADVGIQQMKKDNLSFLPEIFAEKHSKFILKKGDYVIALTRPILNGELKIAKIDDFFDNSLLNQRVGKIVSENNTTYIYNVLQQEWLINVIENNIAGTDPPNLSPKEINHIKLSIPEIPEQTKIANFLSKIDAKINTVTEQIEHTKTYKKGLLQKMFV